MIDFSGHLGGERWGLALGVCCSTTCPKTHQPPPPRVLKKEPDPLPRAGLCAETAVVALPAPVGTAPVGTAPALRAAVGGCRQLRMGQTAAHLVSSRASWGGPDLGGHYMCAHLCVLVLVYVCDWCAHLRVYVLHKRYLLVQPG